MTKAKPFEGVLLAIESSCDETAAAVLCGLEIRSNVISSQIDLHTRTGGVVPEVAARAHVESSIPVIDEALQAAGVSWNDLKAIAVTNRPGLVGCLSVGVTAAKAMAYALDVPVIGVHHLEGHLLSPLATNPNLTFPHICLLVSGGHTELVLVKEVGDYELLGQTRDDAAGEAYDKSARLLGFEYPGGRALSDAAVNGNPNRYRLPRGLDREDTLDFSFSGLKTAVLRLVEHEGDALNLQDATASVQQAINSVLVQRTVEAANRHGVTAVTLAGGVAANKDLRVGLKAELSKDGIDFTPAPLELCTDNAAMIGIAGSFRLANGERSSMSLDCFANAPLMEGRSAEAP